MLRLLRRCLQKDPQLRLRNAGDARLELVEDDGVETIAGATLTSEPRRSRSVLLLGAFLAGVAICATAILAGRQSTAPDRPVRKWLIPQRYQGGGLHVGGRIPIISPDGARVAYVDGGQLWIRDLNALASRVIPVPADAGPVSWPTFSPDSKSLAFAVTRAVDRVSLLRIPAVGGEVTRICDLPPGLLWGVAWRLDGTIIANVVGGSGTRLYKVEESGGDVSTLPIEGEGAALQLRGFRDGTLAYTHGGSKGVSLVFQSPDGTLTPVTDKSLQVGFGSFWCSYLAERTPRVRARRRPRRWRHLGHAV